MEHPTFVIIPLAVSQEVVLGWFGQDNFGQELFLLAWISRSHFSCVVGPDDVIFVIVAVMLIICKALCISDRIYV